MQSPQDSETSIHPRTAADPQGSLAPWSTEDLRAEIARRADAEEAQPLRFHAGTLGELRFRAGDLQRLLEAVPTGIFIRLDLQAPEITMNPAGARMLGSLPTSDTLAKGTSDNVPPVPRFRNGREVPPDELPMQRAIREGVTVSDE